MGRPSRYSPEVRERAVRMVLEHEREPGHRAVSRCYWVHSRKRKALHAPPPAGSTPGYVYQGARLRKMPAVGVLIVQAGVCSGSLVLLFWEIQIAVRSVGWRFTKRMRTDLLLDAFH